MTEIAIRKFIKRDNTDKYNREYLVITNDRRQWTMDKNIVISISDLVLE